MQRFCLKQKLSVLLYMVRVRFPRHHPCSFVLYMLILYNQIRKWKRIYKVAALPTEVIRNFLENKAEDTWDDPNNTVIVNNEYLNDYKLHGGFVMLIKDQVVQRIAYAVGADLSDGTIYVSDCLFFNLGKTEVLKIRPVQPERLSIASEVNVSLISTNHDIGNDVSDVLLKNYFKSPKLVHLNDLLSVDFRAYAPEVFYTNNKLLEVGKTYFKCNKVLGKSSAVTNGTCLCVNSETSLRQSGNKQGFVVPEVRMACGSSSNDPLGCIIDLCPSGLSEQQERLAAAIEPFIQRCKLQLQPVFLLQGNKGSGKYEILKSLALKLGMNLHRVTNLEVSGTVYAQTETKIRNVVLKAKLCAPCILSISNFENFGKNAEGEYDPRITSFFQAELDALFSNNSLPLVLICSSNSKELPPELSRIFLEVFDLGVPNEVQRFEMLQWITTTRNLKCEPETLKKAAGKTHGFVLEDLKALVSYSWKDSGYSSLLDDFEKAIDLMQTKHSQDLGAPKVPKVQWSDVGGLSDVKEEIIKTINLPLKHPELLKSTGLKRSGILLYGPPGTGKTLMAKAVATECNLCFLSVKGPELLNMYVGQSEQNIREVFQRAREASPCVIFFDELDSLAPNRGIAGDSGGVMDRIVSQLLAEMDGLNETATIFIIGATNRPDLIDPALLRPGRFDKLLYVGPCTDFRSKLSVLEALTRKFKFGADVRLETIVKECPENITGADFYGMCSGAWMAAARRVIEQIENGSADGLTHEDVTVTMEDFKETIEHIKPSIKTEDLKYFRTLQQQFGVVK